MNTHRYWFVCLLMLLFGTVSLIYCVVTVYWTGIVLNVLVMGLNGSVVWRYRQHA